MTGNLIFHSDLFLQLLEGPPDLIDILYQGILLDDRHTDIVKLRDEITN
ncbi:BLUF domain-containing protein [Candidatus Puniceispirillum sp.]